MHHSGSLLLFVASEQLIVEILNNPPLDHCVCNLLLNAYVRSSAHSTMLPRILTACQIVHKTLPAVMRIKSCWKKQR